MDTFDLVLTVFGAVVLLVAVVMRFRYRGRVVELETEESLGTFAEIDLERVSARDGRLHYVALRYEEPGNRIGQVLRVEVLVAPADARRLADMLDVAAAPGKTLVQARVAARRGAKVAAR